MAKDQEEVWSRPSVITVKKKTEKKCQNRSLEGDSKNGSYILLYVSHVMLFVKQEN